MTGFLEEFEERLRNNKSPFFIWLTEFVLLSLLLGYYLFGFYYKSFLGEEAKWFLAVLYLVYLGGILPYNLVIKKDNTRFFKSGAIFIILIRTLRSFLGMRKGRLQLRIIENKEQKNALLFFLVKFIFIPAMTKFFVEYVFVLKEMIQTHEITIDKLLTGNKWVYFLSVILVVIDTGYFTFGYLVEHSKLNNRVKSVDSSVLGWGVALACYIPLNAVTFQLFRFYPQEDFFFINQGITTILSVLVVLFNYIYLASTFAMGAKCSNLTNRGIVKRGVYKFVRHPAYSSKLIAWWLMCIPIFNLKVFVSMSAWTIIYLLRAYTEEKHLFRDAEYRAYMKKVKWQFVPGLL